MAEDNVIVVRQKDGSIKAFLNTCPHRGNKLNFTDAGNARGFICNYHGWSFGIDGALRMAGQELFEASGMDRAEHGLHPVAQVASWARCSATWTRTRPRWRNSWAISATTDVMLDMDGEGTEFIGGCVKSEIRCNWKVPVENFIGDIYHALWTHDSAARAMLGGPVAEVYKDPDSYHVNVNGHGWEFNLDVVGNAATLGDKEIRKYLYGIQPKVAQRTGEFRSKMIGSISSVSVFPNLSFLPGQNTFRVWHPRGPGKIELHTDHRQQERAAGHQGPLAEGHHDDVLAFRRVRDGRWRELRVLHPHQRRLRHPPAGPVHGLGRGTRPDGSGLPGNVYRNRVNEANHRAFYQRWLDLMQARARHEVPERDKPALPDSAFTYGQQAKEAA